MQEVKTAKRKTRSTDWHGGKQEGHAERSTQKVSREGFFEEFKELEEQRAKEALELVQKESSARQVGRRRGKSENVAKIGGSRAIKHWNDARKQYVR